MTDKGNIEITPDNVARTVMLVFGTMSDSRPFWCFVAVKPSRHNELLQLVASKKLDLRTYVDDGFGEIVVSGETLMPPNDVIKTISTMFNVPIRQLFANIDVDAKVAEAIQEAKKELGEE